jgi:sugar phosphate isomerase/epimerase
MTVYPRLYLAVDNCFASKRWTRPLEWMEIARDAGIFYVEASADNECDPLYNTPESLAGWLDEVREASAQTGVRVANLYSGHGTYATLGLAHTDPRVRDHIQHDWLEPMIRNAAALGAGLGFFCHAFPQAVLRDPSAYAQAQDDLHARLAQLAAFARATRLKNLSLEQMYSPHQLPWTISGALDLIGAVYRRQGAPLYITLDTGHQIGQRRYLRPDRAQIDAYQRGQADMPWFAYADPGQGIDAVLADIGRRPYLFASAEDGDLYAWLRALGAYSPILHLQQTDGTVSAHQPFTARYNATGIVDPARVLAALYAAYAEPEKPGLPPRCADLYLTLEIFSSTAERPDRILAAIRDSAAYWRHYLPEDGLPLDELVRQKD